MRDGQCNCLAIYDWVGKLPLPVFVEVAKAFFEYNQITPTLLSMNGSNPISFNSANESIISHANQLDLYHAPAAYKQLVFSWDAFASVSMTTDNTLLLCASKELAGFQLLAFVPLIQRISEEVQLQYGIGYTRDFLYGPDLFAHGMVCGLKYSPHEIEERRRVSAWMKERPGASRHLTGMLRDIFPINVLSPTHLLARVGTTTLEQWIQRSMERGSLSPLGNGATLWTLDSKYTDEVRNELLQYNLLITA